MGVKVKTKSDKFDKMRRATEGVNGMKVQCGVLGEQAWLAGIHEYGCNIRVTDKMRAYLRRKGLRLKATTKEIRIPERSFLRNGFDKSEKEIVEKVGKLMPDVLAGKLSEMRFSETVGLLMKSGIQDYARDLRSPMNHPFTVDQKGSGNPLADSGDMIGAIDYEVRR